MNLIVDLDYFQRSQDYLSRCENIIGTIRNTVITQRNGMSARALRSSGASYQIREVCERLEKNKQSVKKMRNVLSVIRGEYIETENKCKQLCGNVDIPADTATNGTTVNWNTHDDTTGTEGNNNTSSSIWDRVWDIIASGGPVGSTLAFLGSLLTGGVTAKDAKFIPGIIGGFAGAFENGKSSFDWKKLVGFDEWKMDKWDDMEFGSGKSVGKNISVAAKWAGYLLSFGFNAYDNFSGDREGENNTFVRALFETLGETAVDIGADVLIGAGIAAGLAAVGAPAAAVGAVVVGGTVLVKWALDGVCEWAFDKDFCETISDFALDTLETVGEVVTDVAEGIKDGVENVVNGIGNAIEAAGDAVSGWWNKVFA